MTRPAGTTGPGIGLGFAALLLASAAQADYWEFLPSVTLGVIHETNPRYTSDNEADATGTYLDATLSARLETPRSRVGIKPRINHSNYLRSNKDLNDDDFYFNADASRRWETVELGSDFSWRDVGIRTSEFDPATPDDIDGALDPVTGSGTVRNLDDTQQTWEISPYATWTISPRWQAGLNATRSEIEYDLEGRDDLFDYEYTSGSATVIYLFDNNNSLRLGGSASRFDSTEKSGPFRNRTDSQTINAGWTWAFARTWTSEVTVGSTKSEIEVSGLPRNPLTGAPCVPVLCTFDSDDRNLILQASVRKRAERTSLNISAARTIAPRSNGTEAVTEQVQLYVDHQLSPRLKATFAFLGSDQSILGVDSAEDRTYFTLDASLRWRMEHNWSVFCSYSYYSSDGDLRLGNVAMSSDEDKNNRYRCGVSWAGTGRRY